MQKHSQSTKSILEVQIMGIDIKPGFMHPPAPAAGRVCPCSLVERRTRIIQKVVSA